MKQAIHFREKGFTVVADPREDGYTVQFSVYRALFDNDSPCWPEKDGGGTYTEEIEKAERELEGYVKWDSCSNWEIDPDSPAMVHFCSKKEATRLGEMLAACYDLAPILMPHHSDWFKDQ